MTTARIERIRGRLVRVPMRRPLGTSAATVSEAPLLLVDVLDSDGVAGHAYVFCYQEGLGRAARALLEDLAPTVQAGDAAPAAVRARVTARLRLPGLLGLTAMVAAAIDMAVWDRHARAAGQPLVRALGAAPRATPAYNSNGLGLIEPPAAAEEALALLEDGFGAVKMRLGRERASDDLAAVRAVRAALPDSVSLMADFNQRLDPPTAAQRCAMLDGEGLAWIEEPVAHDDFGTCARLRARLRTPIQIGENFTGTRALHAAHAAGALDYAMPDADRIGGVSGWIEAAGFAAVEHIPLSSHLYPEISAHLLAASPTAHWLEWVDWASPVLQQPARVQAGALAPDDRPGSGLAWDEDAVRRFLAD